MASFFPQAFIQDLRAFYFLVAVFAVHAAHVLLDFLPQRPAFGVPEDGAGGMFVDMEQVKLFAEFAVVALFGFFEHVQVLLQLFFAGPGCAVNALQHFVAVVAAPVGTCHLHQFEVFELACAGHVRAAAQVFKSAFAVQAYIFVSGNAGNDFGLVSFAHVFEIIYGFIARQHAAQHGLIFAGQLGHFLFDGCKVFGGEGALVAEVVVKAVFYHWADGYLRVGKQFFNSVSQQVGGGVANHLQPIGIFCRDDGERCVLADRVAGINQLAIYFAANGSLGQAAANAGGYFCNGDRRLLKIALRTVG